MNERSSKYGPMCHNVKIAGEYYNAVVNDRKTFEIRKDDRGYKVNDYLLLGFVGHSVLVKVTYTLRDVHGLEPGYVLLGIRKVEDQ